MFGISIKNLYTKIRRHTQFILINPVLSLIRAWTYCHKYTFLSPTSHVVATIFSQSFLCKSVLFFAKKWMFCDIVFALCFKKVRCNHLVISAHSI